MRERPPPNLNATQNVLLRNGAECAAIRAVGPVISENEIETVWDNNRSAIFKRSEVDSDEVLTAVANHGTLPKGHGVTGSRDDALDQGLAGVVGVEQHHDVPHFGIVNLIRELVDDQAVLIMKSRLHASPFYSGDLEPKGHDERGVDCSRRKRAEPQNKLSANLTQSQRRRRRCAGLLCCAGDAIH